MKYNPLRSDLKEDVQILDIAGSEVIVISISYSGFPILSLIKLVSSFNFENDSLLN